ncbi:hypothetical protein CSKR_106333 [Clonorchis sinensis]|uniref:Uncharacterized protein n=1 Tax=Clonorchis sinensis TaxID=79923 RepID=A0A419Q270_CLOSI|nr:hypothetical protein CSKR_106333 [Clonorchis sinensis]
MSPRLVMKRLQSNCQARRTDQQSISAPELPIFHNIADLQVWLWLKAKPIVGCRRILSNLMSGALQIYMYCDISNSVQNKRRGGLVQHIQLLGNIIHERFSWVTGESAVKPNLFANDCTSLFSCNLGLSITYG